MPEYTCEKCARVFTQKGRLTAHQNRKKPCTESTAINEVISQQVAVQVKEAVKKTLVSKQPITKDNLPSFFEALHNLLWNRAGLNPEKALEHMIFFFAYRMIELQADALNLPQECRWSYIANLKDENDLFEIIKKGVRSFHSNKKTKPFFKPHEIQKAELVYDIVEQINRVTLETLQETDILGDIFEHMLSRGMSTMSDDGQYFTNRSICRLAFKLAYTIKQNVRRSDGSLCTFADWFCGTGGFAAEYVKGVKQVLGDNKPNWKKDSASIYCQDMNLSSITTTLLNLLIMTGQPFGTETIRSANSFSDSITVGTDAPFKGLQIDYCFMNPPYGGDKTKGKDYKFKYSKGKGTEKQYLVNQDIRTIGIEDDDKVSAGVQLAMATLSAEGGVCAIVLPQGFFFGAAKKAIELRKKIAEEYKIHYVVDIASGAFANTGTKTSMLVFQRGAGSTEKVKFIGMDEQELVEASLEDLRGKNYSLNYKQYLPQEAVEVEGFEMMKLGDILEKKTSGKTKVGEISNSGEYPFFSCKNENPCGTHSSFDHSEDEYLLFAKSGGNAKQPTGDNLGIGRFYYMTTKSASTSDVCKFILKNSSAILLKYVSIILQTKLHTIQSLARYTTGLGHIDIDEMLDNIQIPLPSLERQQQIVEAIDDWTTLVHQEEQALKTLEKQVMFQVKEMGRRKERVKLGDVCDINHGKRVTKKDNLGTMYPVYGGGDDTFRTDNKNREGFTCKVSRFGISEHNCVQTIYGDYWLMDSGFTVKGISEKANDAYIYYWLTQSKELVYQCGRATAQMNMDMDTFRNLLIPLPPLTEQQTLQSDFDEICHKYAKIAAYKAKAQEAIQRLIPSTS